MTKVREFRNSTATMTVETLEGEWHVVHMTSGCSLDLMKEVFREYEGLHLFACVPSKSKVNRVARLFGELVQTHMDYNIYHIKGD